MKTTYKFLLVILGVSLLTSCEEYSKTMAKELSNPGNGDNKSMYYFQDSRTGLCYSLITYDRGASHTNVPCTDKVMELIAPSPTSELCK